jgi:RNA-directed DNA polymerase
MMSEENQRLTREEWISKIRAEGKTDTIRSEMLRLGFWEEKSLSDEEKQQQDLEDEEYRKLRVELQDLKKRTNQLANVEFLLKEARQHRIEESKRKRAERKAEREPAQIEAKKRWQAYQETHVVHAGEGVSAGLASFESDEPKLMQNQLPLIHSAVQLAEELEITLSQLKWLTYHRNTATLSHYSRFTIPKKSGGKREISAPKTKLKRVQAWVQAQILTNLPVHPTAYGFVTGKSTVDNAQVHVGQAAVIKLDLKDFFPSISFARVKGLFQSFGYSPAISTLFALLCTEPPRKEVAFDGKIYHVAMAERQLPQGACTSPAITNLLCRRLDEKLTNLASEKGFHYTRYADDLTFSGGKEALRQIGSLMSTIRSIVHFEGFTVNEEKTRILRSARRQRVTGIVVNQKPNLTRKDLRAFRALLHNVEQRGIQAENRVEHPNFWEYINGYVSYVRMVRPDLGAKFAFQVQRIGEKYGLQLKVKW